MIATMPQPRIGRPTALTPDVRSVVLDMVSAGGFLHPACEVAGISYRTLARWRARHAAGTAMPPDLAAFCHALKRTEAMVEVQALSTVRASGPDWLAAAWFLSRRFPQRWSRRKGHTGHT
jgi:hypothetical protein